MFLCPIDNHIFFKSSDAFVFYAGFECHVTMFGLFFFCQLNFIKSPMRITYDIIDTEAQHGGLGSPSHYGWSKHVITPPKRAADSSIDK